MFTFPASAIHAVEETGSRLVVTCPPFYVAAAFSFALTVFAILAVWVAAGRDLGRKGMLILISTDLPFLIISAGLATTGAEAVLDTRAGQLLVRTRVFGFGSRRTAALSSVEGAVLQSGRGSQRLAFQLKDGSTIPLGFFTNQAGHSQTVSAINQFLRRRAQP